MHKIYLTSLFFLKPAFLFLESRRLDDWPERIVILMIAKYKRFKDLNCYVTFTVFYGQVWLTLLLSYYAERAFLRNVYWRVNLKKLETLYSLHDFSMKHMKCELQLLYNKKFAPYWQKYRSTAFKLIYLLTYNSLLVCLL